MFVSARFVVFVCLQVHSVSFVGFPSCAVSFVTRAPAPPFHVVVGVSGSVWCVFLFVGLFACDLCALCWCALRVFPAETRLTVYRRRQLVDLRKVEEKDFLCKLASQESWVDFHESACEDAQVLDTSR